MLHKLIYRIIGICAISALIVLSLNVNASDEKWDQNKATELATSLVKHIKVMVNDPTLKKTQPTVFAQRKYDVAVAEFKALHEDAITLSEQLNAGKGYRYTIVALRRVLELSDNVNMYAKDTKITMSIRRRAGVVTDILSKLALLYSL